VLLRTAATFALFLVVSAAWAGSWQGQELEAVIENLRRDGLPVLYSSSLVRSGMPVRTEPTGATPVVRLGQALEPYGLSVRAGPYGSILVVRSAPLVDPVAVTGSDSTKAVPELIVTTSRYQLQRQPVLPVATLANTDLERLPDLGDDPLRAVGRLPGAASNGASAKTNIRGGGNDETLVAFGGLRLFNPFHLKDFQSIFSSIDPAVIEGLNVYTGAFPVNYGDRLSGVIDIESFEPPGTLYRALTLSLFNVAGVISDGWSDGQGTWLLSARRGNLDLVLDLAGQDVGKPRYSDLHGQVAWEFSEQLKLSANALIFDDNIVVFDSDREEEATARYHDTYLWLRADARPTENLSGFTLFSYADLTSRRAGIGDQPGLSSGTLEDLRSAEIVGLATQWSLDVRGGHRLGAGAEFRQSRGRYDYADEVTFDVLFDTPGAPTETFRSRNISLAPEGDYYAAYLHARVILSGDWTTELGLRWDHSTLAAGSGAVSPRASLLYQVTSGTQLRASWGRYWQSQGIDELAVSDGETAFAKPERADQFVLGIEQALGRAATARVEAYTKNYRNPRTRYENLLNSFALLPELKPDRLRISADRATARGIEASIRSRREGPLDWWASYTWSEVRDKIDGVKFRRSWDQTNALSAGVLWSSERWDLSAAANFRTGWPTTQAAIADDGPENLVATGPRNAERLGNYATLDLRAARRFQTSVGLVSAFLEISNSLNRRNECCVEYDIDVGDTDEFVLDRTQSLPLLPSIGVSWQF
jgi:outer membrane receptor protein involved in Fe transport